MNVQLRDSKSLQEMLYSDTKRNQLPRAQLHPELLEPQIDTEAGGFIIRSDNPTDMRHMEHFLIAKASCTASWVTTGPPSARLASELVFAFADKSKLVIRTQAVSDVTRMTSAMPSDRTTRFDATYHDGRMILVRSAADPDKPTSSKSIAELQVEAARNGVKWDRKAELDTPEGIGAKERIIEKIEQAKSQPVK